MFDFALAETKSFIKHKDKLNPKIYEKIKNNIYPQLKSNPFHGVNIKKLKGEFEGYSRYKIGNYRLLYLIENEKVLVIVVDLKHRQNAY